jgi:hypothetical protein
MAASFDQPPVVDGTVESERLVVFIALAYGFADVEILSSYGLRGSIPSLLTFRPHDRQHRKGAIFGTGKCVEEVIQPA